MTTDRMRQAKALIDQRRYREARRILENMPGAKAEDWRRKLDDRLSVYPNDPPSGTNRALRLLLGLLSVGAFAALVLMLIFVALNPRNLSNPMNIVALVVVLGLTILFRVLKARL